MVVAYPTVGLLRHGLKHPLFMRSFQTVHSAHIRQHVSLRRHSLVLADALNRSSANPQSPCVPALNSSLVSLKDTSVRRALCHGSSQTTTAEVTAASTAVSESAAEGEQITVANGTPDPSLHQETQTLKISSKTKGGLRQEMGNQDSSSNSRRAGKATRVASRVARKVEETRKKSHRDFPQEMPFASRE